MADDKRAQKNPHNIIMENRSLLSITGVVDVDSFDEGAVILFTEVGKLYIKGDNLHINRLNVESAEVQIEGEIDSLVYSEDKEKGGFFSRLIK